MGYIIPRVCVQMGLPIFTISTCSDEVRACSIYSTIRGKIPIPACMQLFKMLVYNLDCVPMRLTSSKTYTYAVPIFARSCFLSKHYRFRAAASFNCFGPNALPLQAQRFSLTIATSPLPLPHSEWPFSQDGISWK